MRGSDINIDITRKCTLKCRHCYNHSGEMNNDELASDELFRIMNDLASTRPDNFCICGGEPLLKKEIIFRFIDHQKKINSEMNIGMVTNGELLTESISEKLIYYGLNNIQFSIDGATENSHDWLRNKKGLFENLLHTIMQLNILRRKAKSDTVMLKIWDDESYGMERNMNRSTSEVMRNSRPIKMDENMRNIKVEGDNSFSFVSTFFSVLGRIMINKAAFNILEYCDGDNSVQDICHLLNTKYDIDEDIIYKDVDKTLQLFWRLKVIKMTGENYLLDRFVYISDKLKIKYLQYEELLDLVSNIDSLKDSLVIAEEGLGLLNNENILKLVWSSGIISGFSMEDNNGNVAKIIIQPNIKYKIFEIIYIEDEDKLPERWTDILISFMKKLYRETLEAKTLVEDGEKVVLIYKAFNKVVLDSSFKAIGILKKEYQQKDVYVYSSEQ